MRFCLLFFILLLPAQIIFCQVKAVLVDSLSKEKISYVNIWVENEATGNTSNEMGEFELKVTGIDKIIVFSAIGYKTKKIKAGDIKTIIELAPNMKVLQEVFVRSKKGTEEKRIESFKKSGTNSYFANGGTPWIVAKYFPHKQDYKETPYLKQINILTESTLKNASFNIRLYLADENTHPGESLYDKNIIGIARKGKTITEVDLSDLNIPFPDKGFFIAFEWLIIESNRSIQTYSMKGSKEKLKEIRYQPKIATFKGDKEKNSWTYTNGNWKKWSVRYFYPAIELILTN